MLRMVLDTLWRLLLVQGSRNARYHDGLGFFHIMAPALRRAARSGGERARLVRRYAGYFNANPLLVPAIAGALARMELDAAGRRADDTQRIERVREALSSALSARGDHLTEIAVLPLTLTIGCAFAMYYGYIGPVAFLVLYNCYSFFIRAEGYRAGMRFGERTGLILGAGIFARQRFLGGAAAFAAGAFAAIVIARAWQYGGQRLAVSGLAAAAAAAWLAGRTSRFWVAAALLVGIGAYLAVW